MDSQPVTYQPATSHEIAEAFAAVDTQEGME